MLRKLRDNSGNNLVFSCLFLLFFMMLFAGFFSYMQHKTTVQYIKQTAVNVLDEYTAEQGRKKATSIKNGTVYTVELDAETYSNLFAAALDVEHGLKGYREGRLAFEISDVKLKFYAKNRINSEVSFLLEIPVYIGEARISQIEGIVRVFSKYNTVPIE